MQPYAEQIENLTDALALDELGRVQDALSDLRGVLRGIEGVA